MNKNITTIYHLADIHIKNTNEREKEYNNVFENLYNYIKNDSKLEESIICIAGDLIDFKDNLTGYAVSYLINFLKLFSDLLPIIIISGNHDVCVNNSNHIDLIQSVYKDIKSKNDIFYYRNSGIYNYKNITFYVCSVFDRKLISASDIKNSQHFINNNKLICLHHGFVENKKDKTFNFVKFSNYFKEDDFKGYDIVMLGDIHKHSFISDNIAYPSSLIQQNHGETIDNHGIIKWNLFTNSAQFIQIQNDYGFITLHFEDNKLLHSISYFPKITRLKIFHFNTEKYIIDDIINEISKKTTIESIQKIKTYKNNDDTSNKNNKNNININDFEYHKKIIKSYLDKNLNNYSSDLFDQIIDLHKKYFNSFNLHNIQIKNNNIILHKLQFNNLFSYGSDNILNFDKLKNINCLIGKNASGKSSIIDILTFCLFDKGIRIDNNKKNIENIFNNNYYATLEFSINSKLFKIEKKALNSHNKNSFKRSTKLYEFKDNLFIERNNWINNDASNDIINLLGFTYDDFIYGCLMPQYNPLEILNMKNKDRKDIINKFLRLNFLDDINAKVKDDLKELYIKNQFYNEQISKFNNDINNFYSSENDITILNNDISYYQDIINNIKDKIKIFSNQIIQVHIKNDINTLNDLINSNYQLLKNYSSNYYNINDLKNIIFNHISNYSLFDDLISSSKDISQSKFNNIISDIINIIDQYYQLTYYNKIKFSDISNKILDLKKLLSDEIHNLSIIKWNNKFINIIQSLESSLQIYDNILQNKKKSLLIAQNALSNKNILISQLNELNNKNNDILNKIKIFDIYKNITSINGISILIFDNICIDLQNKINSILDKFNISISLDFSYSKNIFFDIYKVLDNNIKLDANRCSGFEQFIINLAFKISLCDISHISLPKILMIDETISCIDKYNLDKLNLLFDFFRNTFDKVILITHNDKIQNMVDYSIFINKDNNISKIIG